MMRLRAMRLLIMRISLNAYFLRVFIRIKYLHKDKCSIDI
jgi:hypothetical protein